MIMVAAAPISFTAVVTSWAMLPPVTRSSWFPVNSRASLVSLVVTAISNVDGGIHGRAFCTTHCSAAVMHVTRRAFAGSPQIAEVKRIFSSALTSPRPSLPSFALPVFHRTPTGLSSKGLGAARRLMVAWLTSLPFSRPKNKGGSQ
jgi:hypothetical protein